MFKLNWVFSLKLQVALGHIVVVLLYKNKSFQTAEMLLKIMVLVAVQQSVAAHSCLFFTFPQSRLALKVALISLHACSIFFLSPSPFPISLRSLNLFCSVCVT